ncbi:transcriptional regulator [Streptomyces sp. NPDC001843]|uniref:transcriptional regulator n=1 Tax=Streptomyces sp. NPDC001843 TaxID=3364617 RepID=UPI0036BD1308
MDHQTVRMHPDGSSERLLALKDALRDAPVERVRLADLTASFTPRSGGVDSEWALTLAQVESGLPPIFVHRPSLSVIDGLHRVRAARLKGRTHIQARFFDGSRQDAALLAVMMNVTQGRPLPVADRIAAAERIVAERPQWSDRAVAVVAGLSAKKVSELRARLTGLPRCERRVGLDGRTRPLSTVRARELAGELLRADPKASLRTIARQAGISPATVADVRDRLLRGDDPVPPRQRGLATAGRGTREAREQEGRERAEETRSADELFAMLESLRRDPSLRLNEVGRSMLRLLDACALIAGDRRRIISNLPPHCADQLAGLMSGYSALWQLLADELRTSTDCRGAAR